MEFNASPHHHHRNNGSLQTPPPPSTDDTFHYTSPMTTPLSPVVGAATPQGGSQQTPSIVSISSPYQQGSIFSQEMYSGPAAASLPNPCFMPTPTTTSIPNPRGRGSSSGQKYVVIHQETPTPATTTTAGRGTSKRSTAKARGRNAPKNAAQVTAVQIINETVKPDDEIQFVADKGLPVNAGRRGGARSQRLDSILSNGTEMSQEDHRMYKTRENERKRRAAQKNSADRLRELVPGLNDNKSRKVGEGVVMHKSADYIEELQKELAEKTKLLEQQKKECEENIASKLRIQAQASHLMDTVVPMIIKLHKATKYLTQYQELITSVLENQMDMSKLKVFETQDVHFSIDSLSPEIHNIVKMFVRRAQEKKAQQQQQLRALQSASAGGTPGVMDKTVRGRHTAAANNNRELQPIRPPIVQNVNARFIPIEGAAATSGGPGQQTRPQQVILTPVTQDRVRIQSGNMIRQPLLIPNQQPFAKLVATGGGRGARLHRVLSPMPPLTRLPTGIRVATPASLVTLKDPMYRVNVPDGTLLAKYNSAGQHEIIMRLNDGTFKSIVRGSAAIHQQQANNNNVGRLVGSNNVEVVNVTCGGNSTGGATGVDSPAAGDTVQMCLVDVKKEIGEEEEEMSQPLVSIEDIKEEVEVDSSTVGSQDDGTPSTRVSVDATSEPVFGDMVSNPLSGFQVESGVSLQSIKMEPMDESMENVNEEENEQEFHMRDVKTESMELGDIKREREGRDDQDDEEEHVGGEGVDDEDQQRPFSVRGFSISGIGDLVLSDEEEEIPWSSSVLVENDANGVCRIGVTNLSLVDQSEEEMEQGSGEQRQETPSTSSAGVGPSTSGTPAEGTLEYQVMMMQAIEHDNHFREHPLFKHDFLWGGYHDDDRIKQKIDAIVERCWNETMEERRILDLEEEEKYKRRKDEEDDDEFGKRKRGGAGGRKRGGGGGRGKKRGGARKKWW